MFRTAEPTRARLVRAVTAGAVMALRSNGATRWSARVGIALAAAVAAVALPPGAATALRVINLPGAEHATNDPQQGVYVKDSAIAADKFELGKRMERLKEWPKSADVYQEILEKYQDRVVPVQ